MLPLNDSLSNIRCKVSSKLLCSTLKKSRRARINLAPRKAGAKSWQQKDPRATVRKFPIGSPEIRQYEMTRQTRRMTIRTTKILMTSHVGPLFNQL